MNLYIYLKLNFNHVKDIYFSDDNAIIGTKFQINENHRYPFPIFMYFEKHDTIIVVIDIVRLKQFFASCNELNFLFHSSSEIFYKRDDTDNIGINRLNILYDINTRKKQSLYSSSSSSSSDTVLNTYDTLLNNIIPNTNTNGIYDNTHNIDKLLMNNSQNKNNKDLLQNLINIVVIITRSVTDLMKSSIKNNTNETNERSLKEINEKLNKLTKTTINVHTEFINNHKPRIIF